TGGLDLQCWLYGKADTRLYDERAPAFGVPARPRAPPVQAEWISAVLRTPDASRVDFEGIVRGKRVSGPDYVSPRRIEIRVIRSDIKVLNRWNPLLCMHYKWEAGRLARHNLELTHLHSDVRRRAACRNPAVRDVHPSPPSPGDQAATGTLPRRAQCRRVAGRPSPPTRAEAYAAIQIQSATFRWDTFGPP